MNLFIYVYYYKMDIVGSARQNLNLLVACLSHQSIDLVAISHHITHFSKPVYDFYVLSKYFGGLTKPTASDLWWQMENIWWPTPPNHLICRALIVGNLSF